LLGDRVSWVAALAELPEGDRGTLFLCNELLDAFPVHRVRRNGLAWEEIGVTEGAGGVLAFDPRPVQTGALADEVARLPGDLPTGYTTEVHPAAADWMRALCAQQLRGAMLIADYGYEEAEYYAPERSDGTLRRYHQHRVDGEVLKDLGLADLTAHIPFSRVIAEAEHAGFAVKRFMEQGRFLTHAAKPWLASLEGRPPSSQTMALLRQFQSLTHPSHMGAAFRMLLLSNV
jgi:SAM-dependent MidA family methyltransferase